jgi:hypothetical protein
MLNSMLSRTGSRIGGYAADATPSLTIKTSHSRTRRGAKPTEARRSERACALNWFGTPSRRLGRRTLHLPKPDPCYETAKMADRSSAERGSSARSGSSLRSSPAIARLGAPRAPPAAGPTRPSERGRPPQPHRLTIDRLLLDAVHDSKFDATRLCAQPTERFLKTAICRGHRP